VKCSIIGVFEFFRLLWSWFIGIYYVCIYQHFTLLFSHPNISGFYDIFYHLLNAFKQKVGLESFQMIEVQSNGSKNRFSEI